MMNKAQKKAEKRLKRRRKVEAKKLKEARYKLPFIQSAAQSRWEDKKLLKERKEAIYKQKQAIREKMTVQLRKTLGLPEDDKTPLEILTAAVNMKLWEEARRKNHEEAKKKAMSTV